MRRRVCLFKSPSLSLSGEVFARPPDFSPTRVFFRLRIEAQDCHPNADHPRLDSSEKARSLDNGINNNRNSKTEKKKTKKRCFLDER